jgi:hypothetical protein
MTIFSNKSLLRITPKPKETSIPTHAEYYKNFLHFSSSEDKKTPIFHRFSSSEVIGFYY